MHCIADSLCCTVETNNIVKQLCVCIVCVSLQSCPTLCNPMDCSPSGSSGHELSQARILEWVATPSSRGASQPRDRTHVSCSFRTADGFFTAGCHGSSAGKESACNVGVLVRSLGWKDPLEKGNATHSSILAWRIPWTIVYEVPKSWP